jgi:hypothetical protein
MTPMGEAASEDSIHNQEFLGQKIKISLLQRIR